MYVFTTQCFASRIGGIENLVTNLALTLGKKHEVSVFADQHLYLQDKIFDIENIKIFVEPSTIMFILGSKMDYVNNKIESGFVFNNPNEKGRCGCGESFHV